MKRLLFFITTMCISYTGLSAADSWVQIGEDEGITVFQKQETDSEIISLRGETTLNTTIDKIQEILRDNSIAHHWIPLVKVKKDIKIINHNERIEYTHVDLPWPLDDRYFVNKAQSETRPDGKVVSYVKGIEEHEIKEDDKVMGFLYFSGVTMTPLEGGKKTHLIVEINSDPKGSIPKWLVNVFQKDWPVKFFTGLKEQIEKRQKLVSK